MEALATHAKEQGEAFAKEQKDHQELFTKVTTLEGELTALVKRLGDTEDHSQQQRPGFPVETARP